MKRLRVIMILVVGMGVLAVGLPAGASARSQAPRTKTHHATLTVKPKCISVSKHRRLVRVTLRHGVQGVTYSFAVVALFARHSFTWPNMGRHKANRAGMIRFLYSAPDKKRNSGRWQVTATRRVGDNYYKLAALTKIVVKVGRCRKK